MRDYDNICVMALECHILYYSNLQKIKLLLERGIYLDKVLEKLSAFHTRLVATSWICFAPKPYFANAQ